MRIRAKRCKQKGNFRDIPTTSLLLIFIDTFVRYTKNKFCPPRMWRWAPTRELLQSINPSWALQFMSSEYRSTQEFVFNFQIYIFSLFRVKLPIWSTFNHTVENRKKNNISFFLFFFFHIWQFSISVARYFLTLCCMLKNYTVEKWKFLFMKEKLFW